MYSPAYMPSIDPNHGIGKNVPIAPPTNDPIVLNIACCIGSPANNE